MAGIFTKIGKPPQVTRQEAKTVVGTVIGYEYPAAFEVLRQNSSSDPGVKRLPRR
jgi:hypothetical protein